jgi:hypothetical protein
VKWVACSYCALAELAVRDDFDEDTEIVICDDCTAWLDSETDGDG